MVYFVTLDLRYRSPSSTFVAFPRSYFSLYIVSHVFVSLCDCRVSLSVSLVFPLLSLWQGRGFITKSTIEKTLRKSENEPGVSGLLDKKRWSEAAWDGEEGFGWVGGWVGERYRGRGREGGKESCFLSQVLVTRAVCTVLPIEGGGGEEARLFRRSS